MLQRNMSRRAGTTSPASCRYVRFQSSSVTPTTENQQRRHPRLVHPNADPVTGDTRLGHFEQTGPDPVAIANAHLVVGEAPTAKFSPNCPKVKSLRPNDLANSDRRQSDRQGRPGARRHAPPNLPDHRRRCSAAAPCADPPRWPSRSRGGPFFPASRCRAADQH
jgi:hypothetical protein